VSNYVAVFAIIDDKMIGDRYFEVKIIFLKITIFVKSITITKRKINQWKSVTILRLEFFNCNSFKIYPNGIAIEELPV
jgi:hypothetical protein